MPNPTVKQLELHGTVYDLQVDSVNNCNPTATNTNKYDWIGTQAEYVAQDVATNHPDWVCFITDDISDETGIINLGNYVKKTGNETISGTKTFTSAVRIERPSGQRLVIRQDNNNVDIGSLESIDDGNNNKTELFAFSENGTQNAILGVTYGNGSPYAYAPTPSAISNNNTIVTTSYITTILSTLYPIGSVYASRINSNPLETLIPDSTWIQISTTMITSVDSSAAVKGNGKTLGLTNGSSNYGLYCNMGVYGAMFPASNGYDTNAGSSASYNQLSVTLGVTTDASKSGIEATVNSNSVSLYMWERTA